MIKNLEEIVVEIKQNANKKYHEGASNYFKEGIILYGVRLPIVRKIASKHWKFLPSHEKKEVFRLCEELLKNNKQETHTVAFQWAYAVRKQYTAKDFFVFEKWLKKYVDNWAKCDDLCGGALGYLVLEFPEVLPNVFKWTKEEPTSKASKHSSNRWMKRASAVSLIVSLRKGKYLKNAFKTSDALLADKDDLVQKGYGWMLKEATRKYEKEVFSYVMKNKGETTPLGVHTRKMPRTALRYAIEKIPEGMKKRAMN